MTDVLQNATKYRSRLKAEMARVDEFLRMAEEFSKDRNSEADLTLNKAAANTAATEPPAIELARRSPKEATAG